MAVAAAVRPPKRIGCSSHTPHAAPCRHAGKYEAAVPPRTVALDAAAAVALATLGTITCRCQIPTDGCEQSQPS